MAFWSSCCMRPQNLNSLTINLRANRNQSVGGADIQRLAQLMGIEPTTTTRDS